MSEGMTAAKVLANLMADQEAIAARIEAVRTEAMTAMAKSWQDQANEVGVSVQTVLGYLEPETKARKAGGSKDGGKELTGWVRDTIYADPANQMVTWKGGSKGRKPDWLIAAIGAGKTWHDLIASA
jgi:hypothetical protein